MRDANSGDPTIDEIVRFLSEGLGRPLLACTVGVRRRTLAVWLRGSASPSHRSRDRLAGAFTVWNIVAEVEGPDTVRAWFMRAKDALYNYSPAEVIAEGRVDDVIAVARLRRATLRAPRSDAGHVARLRGHRVRPRRAARTEVPQGRSAASCCARYHPRMLGMSSKSGLSTCG